MEKKHLWLYKLKINACRVASGPEKASRWPSCAAVSGHHGAVTFGDWEAVPLNDLRGF